MGKTMEVRVLSSAFTPRQRDFIIDSNPWVRLRAAQRLFPKRSHPATFRQSRNNPPACPPKLQRRRKRSLLCKQAETTIKCRRPESTYRGNQGWSSSRAHLTRDSGSLPKTRTLGFVCQPRSGLLQTRSHPATFRQCRNNPLACPPKLQRRRKRIPDHRFAHGGNDQGQVSRLFRF